ncbi:hypothetical protein F511_29821 [Dorcoceras hygrometricum]|uniref:Uncharacterized protein n=1 Tax=Dorcoceras hygrometricum TaxID=472368 RepID=A0A2Z7D305_9LAMI|nr:hypothetical protein F511_29821 [Dorcoceras hygrometricum]
MSLFDLQDVCMDIGSITTLDLPMVVDLIGICGLKGPYCMLTTTNWFLQALSVIPRGSWGDVARRFTMIRWAKHHNRRPSPLYKPPPPCAAAAAPLHRKIVSGQFDEENPSAQISSRLIVQGDEGVSYLFYRIDRLPASVFCSSAASPGGVIRIPNKIQKPANDRTGLGLNTGESGSGETCTQSNLANDKFKKISFVKASVIHDICESVRPESSKSGWLKNRLDKEKAKAGSKSFVQNQQRRGSKKVKSEWKKVRPRRYLNGQNTKPKLNRSHSTYAQTLMDYHIGKAVKVIQVWVPKGRERYYESFGGNSDVSLAFRGEI